MGVRNSVWCKLEAAEAARAGGRRGDTTCGHRGRATQTQSGHALRSACHEVPLPTAYLYVWVGEGGLDRATGGCMTAG